MKAKSLKLYTVIWARVVLGAVLLASKVWDDHAIWNVDFCQVFPDVPVEEMNELERYYLRALGFNTNVSIAEYTKAYFLLMDCSSIINAPWALKPLKMSQLSKIQVYY